MARGDTQPPRKHFAEDESAPVDTAPKRLRYPCKAHDCPMPGTVDDTCGWHYLEIPSDWPRITQAIRNWECVAMVINRARRFSNDPATCSDVKAERKAKSDAWAMLLPAVVGSGWRMRVEPRENETFGDWGRRLEVFLSARIKSDLQNCDVDERKPTPAVEEIRKGMRAEPLTTLET